MEHSDKTDSAEEMFYDPRNFIKRCASTIGLVGNANLDVRETHSFNAVVDELRTSLQQRTNLRQDEYCEKLRPVNMETNPTKIEQMGYRTQEVTSKQIYIIDERILLHRGKQYSLHDIAKLWKKDCRTWLWKSKLQQKKHKSMEELREKLQAAKINN